MKTFTIIIFFLISLSAFTKNLVMKKECHKVFKDKVNNASWENKNGYICKEIYNKSVSICYREFKSGHATPRIEIKCSIYNAIVTN